MAKRKTLLLCCDIDGTLTMDSEALSAFYEEVKALKLVCNVVLVYNTGRGWDEYHAQLGKNPEYKEMKKADYHLAASGTELWTLNSNEEWDFCEEYHDYLTNIVGFSKEKIMHIDEHPAEDLCKPITKYGCMDKIRHTVQINKNRTDIEGLVEQWKKEYPDVNFVLERNVEWMSGHGYLDCFPANTDKGPALKWLVKKLDLENEAIVVWCGDSPNDLSFFETPYFGIIVGNGNERLKAKAIEGQHYIAKNKYAAGILEGLDYFCEDKWGIKRGNRNNNQGKKRKLDNEETPANNKKQKIAEN